MTTTRTHKSHPLGDGKTLTWIEEPVVRFGGKVDRVDRFGGELHFADGRETIALTKKELEALLETI